LAELARVGIRRANTDDVARLAQLDRTTVYRRMGTKNRLIQTALTYELHRVFTRIAAQLNPRQTIDERTAHGFALTVLALRGHPLLRQALTVSADDMPARLAGFGTDLLTTATILLADHVGRAWSAAGSPPESDPEPVAAIIVRLAHSLVVIPDAPPRLGADRALRDFSRAHVAHLVRPPQVAGPGRSSAGAV
jgi:AcrR family transcriptional regulator